MSEHTDTVTVSADATPVDVRVLEELAALYVTDRPSVDGLARALERLDASGGTDAAGAQWWSDFDAHARIAHRRLHGTDPEAVQQPDRPDGRPARPDSASPVPLTPFWTWALAACAADGHTREAALRADRLPLGRRGLLPLLVVRCADWAPAVRAGAGTALAGVVATAEPPDLAWAARCAWSCERRERGVAAVGIVTDRLAHAPESVWRNLLTDPDYLVRRRALAEAVALDRCEPALLCDLALSREDVLVAQRAAEQLLRVLVPQGADAPAGPESEETLLRLLTSGHPAVRATTVTALRRAQRPDLAEPFVADPAGSVREVARWVLRSRGVDPAEVCRARAGRAQRPEEITPGLVLGLAECGDRTDLPWLRELLGDSRPKVRAAALHALARMRPSGVSRDELCAVLDQESSPGVLRVVARLLEPDAASVPRHRLDAWLAPDRPALLRRHAARLLRLSGTWDRLEVDLRLLCDSDEALAAGARQDAQAWARSARATYALPRDGQHQVLRALFAAHRDCLDPLGAAHIRAALAHSATPR